MKLVIIIPTYNERENIQKLIPQIQLAIKDLEHKVSILVVDDASPDGTGKLVKNMQKKSKKIFLVTGEKKGLGNAYIRGIKYAIEDLVAEVIVEMDADFSHNPNDIPRLINKIEEGADFVIGSRYVKGGKISNWSGSRRLISSWGNRFARYFLGISDVTDCTSGFRAIKATCLRKIDFNLIKESGYSFQVRLLYEAKILRVQIKEVPINFVDRRSGETKLGSWDIIEFIVMSLRIGLSRLLRLNL